MPSNESDFDLSKFSASLVDGKRHVSCPEHGPVFVLEDDVEPFELAVHLLVHDVFRSHGAVQVDDLVVPWST